MYITVRMIIIVIVPFACKICPPKVRWHLHLVIMNFTMIVESIGIISNGIQLVQFVGSASEDNGDGDEIPHLLRSDTTFVIDKGNILVELSENFNNASSKTSNIGRFLETSTSAFGYFINFDSQKDKINVFKVTTKDDFIISVDIHTNRSVVTHNLNLNE